MTESLGPVSKVLEHELRQKVRRHSLVDFRLHAPDSDTLRDEFSNRRSHQALAIVRREVLRRRSPRKPLGNLRLLDSGLWSRIPAECWRSEREITRIQDTAFTLTDPDGDAARSSFVRSKSAEAMEIVVEDINARSLSKRKPSSALHISDHGLWANCPEHCWDLELKVMQTQKSPFRLTDPDEPIARAKFERTHPHKAKERMTLVCKIRPPKLPGMDSGPVDSKLAKSTRKNRSKTKETSGSGGLPE